jgi:L-ascorbate metabolism protein UlaG (beta-lactamase superfamily)
MRTMGGDLHETRRLLLIQTFQSHLNGDVATGPSRASLRLTYLGHATVLLEIDGVRILTDPLLRPRTVHLTRRPIDACAAVLERVDVVAISHLHLDHFDLPSLRMLPRDVPVLAPSGAGRLMRVAGFSNVSEVMPGDRVQVSDVSVEVTRANHDGYRPPFGPHAGCVGYRFNGSQSVYFAGDTDLFPEMRQIGEDLDVALLPVWGWGPTLGPGHLDPLRAAHALTMLEPKVAIPIHWGTLCPIGLRWTRPGFLTEPPHRFVASARRIASSVEVRIVEPGGSTKIRTEMV